MAPKSDTLSKISGSFKFSDRLLYMNGKIRDDEFCDSLRSKKDFFESTICVGGEFAGKSACIGDGGGPFATVNIPPQ